MDRRSSSDVGFEENEIFRSANTTCDIGSLEPIDQSWSSGSGQSVHDKTVNGSELNHGPSILQMAFLQLMTRKVMEAVHNRPDVLDQLNASIRNDRD